MRVRGLELSFDHLVLSLPSLQTVDGREMLRRVLFAYAVDVRWSAAVKFWNLCGGLWVTLVCGALMPCTHFWYPFAVLRTQRWATSRA